MPITWTVGTSPNAELVNTMLDNAIGMEHGGQAPLTKCEQKFE